MTQPRASALSPADAAAAGEAATDAPAASRTMAGRTAWARNLETPLREFLRTETGSAAVLLAATVAALAWVNIDSGSYERAWHTVLSVRLGGMDISQDLRHWVSNGLMALFFFVVGEEGGRDMLLCDLRERRRVALPVLAGLGGMVVPVAIYLAFTAGSPSTHGWGTAMSTDTAFALGMLALVAPRFPERLRAFVLTVAVVDDLVAILVISVAYSEDVRSRALFVAIGLFVVVLGVRAAHIRSGALYALLAIAAWVAMLKSGVDPIVVGLVIGLLTYAYPAARTDLERASDLFRLFREQPTPELAREARTGLITAISPNERLAQLFHPWTSYVIVPLFALANAGVTISPSFLARGYTSAITLGILVGFVVGKPVGIVGTAWVVSRVTGGRLRPPVGWAAVAGGGSIAGIGFTVSLLIAGLAFHGDELEEAKLGVLTSALAASLLTWGVYRATRMLPARLRATALLGLSETIVDLAEPVDPHRDHIRGPDEAAVTLVEYGDFECPYCGQAEPVVRELLAAHGDIRYVWRHLPLTDVHPNAELAAEAAEAAGAQGKFWEMHDLLFTHQDALVPKFLLRYAEQLGLDTDRFHDDLMHRTRAGWVARDVESADLSGVSGTPTFFINGQRHQGAYDIATLTKAVKTAGVRAAIRA